MAQCVPMALFEKLDGRMWRLSCRNRDSDHAKPAVTLRRSSVDTEAASALQLCKETHPGSVILFKLWLQYACQGFSLSKGLKQRCEHFLYLWPENQVNKKYLKKSFNHGHVTYLTVYLLEEKGRLKVFSLLPSAPAAAVCHISWHCLKYRHPSLLIN